MVWACGPVALAGLCLCATRTPLVLCNLSESLPIGLYRRVHAPIRPGVIIAFHVPDAGRAYAAKALPARLATSILKPVVATAGAVACADRSGIKVGPRVFGPIAQSDRRGVTLPHWRGCRMLLAGESLVVSVRIHNSFDSRYYGPVPARDVLGVYRPFWTVDHRPGERQR
jgi:type IV secretory pathway protease TraF